MKLINCKKCDNADYDGIMQQTEGLCMECSIKRDELYKNEAKQYLLGVDNGLETAMKNLKISSLSTDDLIRITEYGVRSGVITTKALFKIEQCHQIIYKELQS